MASIRHHYLPCYFGLGCACMTLSLGILQERLQRTNKLVKISSSGNLAEAKGQAKSAGPSRAAPSSKALAPVAAAEGLPLGNGAGREAVGSQVRPFGALWQDAPASVHPPAQYISPTMSFHMSYLHSWHTTLCHFCGT